MTAPLRRDWRVVLLAVGGGAGGLLCLGLAAATAGYSLVEPWLRPAAVNHLRAEDANAIYTLSAGMVLIAALLLATVLAACRAVRGQDDKGFVVKPMRWYAVTGGLLVWLGASALAQILHDRDAARWASPLLQLTAIVTPIYVFIRLGIAGIAGGSKLRLLGSASAGMLLGTGLAAAIEVSLLAVAMAAAGAYLIANPQQLLALQQLAIQLAHAAKPEQSLALLAPILTKPLALVLALAAISVATPFIEEIAKSVPVWALHDRISTGAQGFWAGALSGAGFALLEGLMVSSSSAEGLGMILMFRAGSSLMHILASGVAGWGIGAFRRGRSVISVVAGYVTAMGIHALWNAVIVSVGYGGLRASYAATQPDSLGLMLSIFGVTVLAVLMAALPIALTVLNRRFRDRETAAPSSTHSGMSAPPATAAENSSEAS